MYGLGFKHASDVENVVPYMFLKFGDHIVYEFLRVQGGSSTLAWKKLYGNLGFATIILYFNFPFVSLDFLIDLVAIYASSLLNVVATYVYELWIGCGK